MTKTDYGHIDEYDKYARLKIDLADVVEFAIDKWAGDNGLSESQTRALAADVLYEMSNDYEDEVEFHEED